MSELDHVNSPATQRNGAKCQAAQSSTAESASSSISTKHPFASARACLMQAKLKDAGCTAAASSITLAGCGENLTQRRLSNTLASTSQCTEGQKAGAKGSRASRPSRAAKGTGRGTRSTRGKAAPSLEEEVDSQSQLGVGEYADRERRVMSEQAELLLHAYHASHGNPLLHR